MPPAALRSLFEAARWAPSSMNEQPWRFVLATRDDPEAWAKMVGILKEGNARWAPNAPVIILSVVKRRVDRTGNENRVALHDLGLAVANLVAQATALGLVTHQMGGIHLDRAREAFGIPDGFDPVAGIAIGYPGDHEALPDDLRERDARPRTRNPLPEFVFSARWGEPSPLVRDED